MALTESERWDLIAAASELAGELAGLAALAASDAPATRLVLKANGVKVKAKALFDDLLGDALDNP